MSDAPDSVEPGPRPQARVPVWRAFDPDWYLRRHPDAAGHMARLGIADPEQYYWSHGSRLGHSPNMFFDEGWYLSTYPDIADHVAAGGAPSGFVHYIRSGHAGRSPHWLFDEQRYRSLHRDLATLGENPVDYLNGYDHYLDAGDAEGRSGHRLFDQGFYRDNVVEDEATAAAPGGPFRHFLREGGSAGNVRLSWYFDPDWYGKTYPEVAVEIRDGLWRSPLQHYLCNRMPWRYCPNPWFSEAFYAELYPDAAAEVAEGKFRNGYEHFLRFGAVEGRNPCAALDLRAHLARPRVQAEIARGPHRDAFAHWLATRDLVPEAPVPLAEAQCKALFARKAELALATLARGRLDFAVEGVAFLSVVMVMHNQFALTMGALASLRANHPGAIELILVDSGSSDESVRIARFVSGARHIRFDENVGFVTACNAAIAQASARFVLFLNNDVLLGPAAIERALARIGSSRDIGAVGGRIVRSNGLLQEAGCIVWNDGSTVGVLRDADPDSAEANYVRDVDFCSGVFLLVRADHLRMLGGFDPEFAPAYYEETDFCVRLWKSGIRVVYDPGVVVEHLEFGSSGEVESGFMIARNRELFVRRHADWLRHKFAPDDRNRLAAGRIGRGAGRILLIEDRIPLRAIGSGFVRSNDIVRCMSSLGYQVTVYPTFPSRMRLFEALPDFPDDVELVIDRGMDALAEFVAERSGWFDLVWIGRTHNLHRLQPILDAAGDALPQGAMVLDTEAVAAPRAALQAELLGLPQEEPLATALRRELAPAYCCQRIVAVNALDAELIREAGHAQVSVLGHMQRPAPTPARWADRADLLFLGALHDEAAPNYDSLRWFCSEVLPLLPEGIGLTIAGHAAPGIDLAPFAAEPRVTLLGEVDELAALFDRHRLFVAPTRFAGGLPFKVHEAAAHGLPVVASALLCRQVGWADGREIQDGGSGDPERFAGRVLAAYRDQSLWHTLRDGALARIRVEHDPADYRARLERILEGVMEQRSRSA